MRGEKRKRTPTRADGIHPRNKYRVPPDFKELSASYPSLLPYLLPTAAGGMHMQWHEPDALRELTKALLHRDFGLTWDMPSTNLCPTLTNRLNYIHWIEDLLLLSRRTYVGNDIVGIDVGTGASCIYPLLGHALNQWRFVATDIDAASLECARVNVAANDLEQHISLRLVDGASCVLPTSLPPAVDFSMCNPPFFDSMDEADTNPRTSCTGSLNEMTTPGGEVAFIERLIDASRALQTQVRWYTSLIGRKSSLRPLLATLRAAGIRNTRTTEFLQGRTTRWGLAWSFTSDGMDAADLAAHKVLGKRKERQRRDTMAFQVDRLAPMQEASPIHGCRMLCDVHARILESPAHVLQGCLAVEPLGDSTETKSNYMLTYERDGAVEWVAEASVLALDTTFDVTLTWRDGKRDLFWQIADQWKGAIVRTGRTWRKRHQGFYVDATGASKVV